MGEYYYSTEEIAQTVRSYDGVTRKKEIGEMVKALRFESPDVIASFGEDAAVIRHCGEALLLAADGIWSRLMEADPYWAGYCAVLVNIHDIAAMGGKPLAMVDILSISDEQIKQKVIMGMRDASIQFGIPVVGGHLHPDTPYNVIDVAILGVAEFDSVIYSNTAQSGDSIIAAIDVNGRVHPSCSLNWDSASIKTPDEVRLQIGTMEKIGKAHLANAAKDISNPGIIGTLAMLLEVSGKGADIDLDAIPRPDMIKNNITFDQWVRMYPGMGFILTVQSHNCAEILEIFNSVNMAAKVIGTVNSSGKLRIYYKEESSVVFNFSENGGVMNLGSYN